VHGPSPRRAGTPAWWIHSSGATPGGVAQPGRALRSQRRSRRFKSDHLHEIPPETVESCPFGGSLRSGVEPLHSGSTVCVDLASGAPSREVTVARAPRWITRSRSVLWCRTRLRPSAVLRAEVRTADGAGSSKRRQAPVAGRARCRMDAEHVAWCGCRWWPSWCGHVLAGVADAAPCRGAVPPVVDVWADGFADASPGAFRGTGCATLAGCGRAGGSRVSRTGRTCRPRADRPSRVTRRERPRT
jgi:hypothetical protein